MAIARLIARLVTAVRLRAWPRRAGRSLRRRSRRPSTDGRSGQRRRAAALDGRCGSLPGRGLQTQRTWRWCTAAGVQIMRNIVHDRTDHSRANQQRYFAYMRAHDRYAIPLADGVDPAGWAAGLRRWVDARYRVVAKARSRARSGLR